MSEEELNNLFFIFDTLYKENSASGNLFESIKQFFTFCLEALNLIAPVATAYILWKTLESQKEEKEREAQRREEERNLKLASESIDRYEKFIGELKQKDYEGIYGKDEYLDGKKVLGAILKFPEFYESQKINYNQIKNEHYSLINRITSKLYTCINLILDLPEKTKQRYLLFLRNTLSYEEQKLIFLEIYYIEYELEESKKYESKKDFVSKVKTYNIIADSNPRDMCLILLNYFDINTSGDFLNENLNYTKSFFEEEVLKNF